MNLLEHYLQKNHIEYTITSKQVTLTQTKKLLGIIPHQCPSGNAYRQTIKIEQNKGPFSIITECSYGIKNLNPKVVINGNELKEPFAVLMAIIDDVTFATTPCDQSEKQNIKSFYPQEIAAITESIYRQYVSQK